MFGSEQTYFICAQFQYSFFKSSETEIKIGISDQQNCSHYGYKTETYMFLLHLCVVEGEYYFIQCAIIVILTHQQKPAYSWKTHEGYEACSDGSRELYANCGLATNNYPDFDKFERTSSSSHFSQRYLVQR